MRKIVELLAVRRVEFEETDTSIALTIHPTFGGPYAVALAKTDPAAASLRQFMRVVEIGKQLDGEKEAGKPKTAADPWIQEVYDLTNEYHARTGQKVQIGDLLAAFFAETIQGVDIEDRDAFMARLKERLA